MEKYSDRVIECPKCNLRFLRNSIPQKKGFEFFCDHCHLYFGKRELLVHWGILVEEKKIPFPILTPCQGEPVWNSEEDRISSYNEVSEMQMGIEAYRNSRTCRKQSVWDFSQKTVGLFNSQERQLNWRQQKQECLNWIQYITLNSQRVVNQSFVQYYVR